MKRLIKCSVLCLSISALLMFSSCRDHDYRVMEEYCYKINSIIKDIDFYTAKIEDGEIVLYDLDSVCIQQIPFEETINDKRIAVVRKDENRVYFVISGAVDDEQGLLFINDDSNAVLDGMKSVERIGGNSYWYRTCE